MHIVLLVVHCTVWRWCAINRRTQVLIDLDTFSHRLWPDRTLS